jgi:D-glycero-D-manno-heptose 1,7-bisphosphate phosphatase
VTSAGSRPKRPAVLLDRDGTLNENLPQGVTRLEEFEPIPGAFEAVGRLCRAGWPVAVITNQSGVSKGIVTREVVDEVNRRCAELAAEHGATFDGIYVATDLPGSGGERRKPRPGMIAEAAREHGYDLFRSYVIGDSFRDMLAGRAAGCTPLLVLTGRGRETRESLDHPPHLSFESLAEAVDWILARSS